MFMQTKRKIEFGDFQTPDVLCRSVCDLLCSLGVSPKSIVEPTCGKGSFLRASVNAFPQCNIALGFEINPEYARTAGNVQRARVYCENFFEKNWPATLDDLPELILVIGNPPWVTNSAVGSLHGTNLPTKSNFQRLNGFDALTGKSNFDISEWMLQHLLQWLSGRSAVLAMLCKTMVARKVLQHSWRSRLPIRKSAMYAIDASEYFGASVDACLLVCVLESRAHSQECAIHPNLQARKPDSVFSLRNGILVANSKTIGKTDHLHGVSPIKWRSGIKHDCARVMELHPENTGIFKNGLGKSVKLESDFLYPMLKSSELMKPQPVPSRYMLVTQQSIGEDTSPIERTAPRTWRYLESHEIHLNKRASTIYRNRPRFSVFGVGPYAFAPWKVAISGFYKRLHFQSIGPIRGKPVVFDDTCYFLPCRTEEDARLLTNLLNSEPAMEFFNSLIFWDAKRPITADILGRLNLTALSAQAGIPLPDCVQQNHELPMHRTPHPTSAKPPPSHP